MKTRRSIIRIDELRCDGCGICVTDCAQRALRITDGKAGLIEEALCAGLGGCLGHCPRYAITMEYREAEEYDEHALYEHLARIKKEDTEKTPWRAVLAHSTMEHPAPYRPGSHADADQRSSSHVVGGCLGSRMKSFNAFRREDDDTDNADKEGRPSRLRQWPVHLMMVSPAAPYFRRGDLLIAAVCAPFAYADFHQNYLKGKSVIVGCPKFDDLEYCTEKLTELFRSARPTSITTMIVEVPRCSNLPQAVHEAAQAAGIDAPIEDVIVSRTGNIL